MDDAKMTTHLYKIMRDINKMANNSGEKKKNSKFMLIFDGLGTLQTQNHHRKSSRNVCGSIFIKNAINRSLLYRSPFYIDHEIDTQQIWNYSSFEDYEGQNFFMLEEGEKITI